MKYQLGQQCTFDKSNLGPLQRLFNRVVRCLQLKNTKLCFKKGKILDFTIYKLL